MLKGKASHLFVSAVLLAAVLSTHESKAQGMVTVREDATTYMFKTEEINKLGDGIFGDSTDYYTGSTTFQMPEISIPGNSDLAVSWGGIQFNAYDDQSAYQILSFMTSDASVPYMHGIFSSRSDKKGWLSSNPNNPAQRCSVQGAYGEPPEVNGDQRVGTFEAIEYWHGNYVFIPGLGNRLLHIARSDDPNKPADGKQYEWVTDDYWYFSCLSVTKNGQPGEGFLARSPDGEKYYFDWVDPGFTPVKGVMKPAELLALSATPQASGTNHLYRGRYEIKLTRVEDRFGNWVNYERSAEGDVTAIVANDGRKITITPDSTDSRIQTISDGSRSWRIDQTSGYKLTYPDNSVWSISWSGGFSPTASKWCQGPTITGEATVVVRHPAGSVGTFIFKPMRRGLSYTKYYSPEADDCLQKQNLFDQIALSSKSISGLGIPTKTWTVAYGPPNDCRLGGASNPCTSSSPVTRIVEVSETGGKYTRHTFSNNEQQMTDGLLLKEEIGTSSSSIARQISYSWELLNAVGIVLSHSGFEYLNTMRRVQKEVKISQDGVFFTATTNNRDAFGRPTSGTRSSSLGYSRSETTAYYDNLAKWVLGQVKSVTCTAPAICANKVVSRVDYDMTTALPLKIYAFDALEKTTTYNADGTVASVADARDGTPFDTTIKYSDWKRGIPQTTTYPATPDQPAAVTKKAIVDGNGWIKSITNENGAGFTTAYDHDAMGRVKLIDYPDGDSVSWVNTTQSFAPSTAAYYGLPVGTWLQIVETGKRRQVTFFDGLWRPVVQDTYDNTSDTVRAETRSIVVKRYDARGRLVFQSYPVRSLTSFTDTSLKGTTTSYDALDRPTIVKQDSELGVLTTTTEYLSGFQTRVTNPRGQKTTTRYMALDQPTTDLPVEIDQPEGVHTSIKRDAFGKALEVTRSGPDQ